LHKYANGTYLIFHTTINYTSVAEISHIVKWVEENKLLLNFKRSVVIVFVPPRSRIAIEIAVPAIPTIEHVEMI